MSECEHKKPILVAMHPDKLFPDDQPYDDEPNKHIKLATIYDYNIIIHGHYCPDCNTLLDVDCDGD